MTPPAVLDPWLAGPRAPELLFLLLALPVLGLLLAPLLGACGARLVALSGLVLGLALALACAAALIAADAPLVYPLGGWSAPLGIELYLDGPAALMLVLTAALVQVCSHALAKASLFLVAGRILASFGHDRLADLGASAAPCH